MHFITCTSNVFHHIKQLNAFLTSVEPPSGFYQSTCLPDTHTFTCYNVSWTSVEPPSGFYQSTCLPDTHTFTCYNVSWTSVEPPSGFYQSTCWPDTGAASPGQGRTGSGTAASPPSGRLGCSVPCHSAPGRHNLYCVKPCSSCTIDVCTVHVILQSIQYCVAL